MDGDRQQRIRSFVEDGTLGRWRMDLCRPRAQLAPFVSQLWYGQGQVNYRRDRILPGGASFLLINLGPTQYRIDPGPPERRVAFDDIWLSGLQQTPIDTEAPHGSALLGVVFRGHGLRPWLHADAEHVSDRTLPLTDLLGDGVLRLRDRLLETPSVEARFVVLEDWLASRLLPRFAPSPLIDWALAAIESSDGSVGIEDLAVQAGVSRAHLSRRFRLEVGLTPKTLARVHRFRAAIDWLSRQPRIAWGELADRCGYYDQSHLIRDFRDFSGMAPGDFIRCGKPDGGSVVVG